MDPEFRPGLCFPLNIDHDKGSLVLSNDTERITLTGIDPSLGGRVIEMLNRRKTVREVLLTFNNDPDNVSKFIETLISEKIVTAAPCCYTGAQISSLLQSFFSTWNDLLFSHPLWRSLADGKAPTPVLDGWLVETYFFIRGANARLSYAASQTSDLRVRGILVGHYVEEFDHYKFFAESLRCRGIDPAAVDRLGPLLSTSAVINMARRAARLDYLAYAACSGLLESTGSDSTRARLFYNKLAANYDHIGSGFVEPMLRHVALDDAYQHGSVMSDIFNPIQRIEPERADRIIECAFQFKETLWLWFNDIHSYYHRYPFDGTKVHRHYRRNWAL